MKAGALYALEFAQASQGCLLTGLNGEESATKPDRDTDYKETNDNQRPDSAPAASSSAYAKATEEVSDPLHHLVKIYFGLFWTIHRQSDFRYANMNKVTNNVITSAYSIR